MLHSGLLAFIIWRFNKDKKLCNGFTEDDNEAVVCKNGAHYKVSEKGEQTCMNSKQVYVCRDGLVVENESDCNQKAKVCTDGFVIDRDKSCNCKKNTKNVALLRNTYMNEYLRDSWADYDEKCEFWPYIGTKKTGINLNLYFLLIMFTVVTVIAHLFYAFTSGYTKIFSSYYYNYIEKSHNPFRWIEYSITAPTMLVILAILASVRDQNTLLLLGVASGIQMLQGWYIEDALRKTKIEKLRVVGHFGIGVLLLVITWVVVFDNWYRGIKNSFDTYDSCTNTTDAKNTVKELAMPPKAIVHVILITFLLFSCFGGVSFTQILTAISNINIKYIKFEYAYIALSFISKALLIIFCAFSIFEGELTWLQTCPSNEIKTCIRKILIDPENLLMQPNKN